MPDRNEGVSLLTGVLQNQKDLCVFNYEARTTEFNKLGRLTILKVRMNAELHMAEDLKNTGKGNHFVIFGEPDINLLSCKDALYQVKVNGVDVFNPSSGEVRSDTSPSFKKPQSVRIAVKVINHLDDEVMKVFKVE